MYCNVLLLDQGVDGCTFLKRLSDSIFRLTVYRPNLEVIYGNEDCSCFKTSTQREGP